MNDPGFRWTTALLSGLFLFAPLASAQDAADGRAFIERHEPLTGIYDLYDGETLLVSIIPSASIIYDQRNSELGDSRGPEVTGWYHEQQPVHARDAAAAVAYVRSRPDVDPDVVGVIGWSGGGWMGALVAAEVSDLAFYVNIAGNASPGIDQAQHRYLARMIRDGFSDADVAAAEDFLTTHHDVARGLVSWEDYLPIRDQASENEWYKYLTGRFNMTYDHVDDATRWGSAVMSAPAERDYAKVTVPTLGIFFEFDHSSTPETPLIFHRALHEAGNGDFTIRMIPRAHHGGFEVDSYRFDTQKLARRSPEIFRTIAEFVGRYAR